MTNRTLAELIEKAETDARHIAAVVTADAGLIDPFPLAEDLIEVADLLAEARRGMELSRTRAVIWTALASAIESKEDAATLRGLIRELMQEYKVTIMLCRPDEGLARNESEGENDGES